MRIRTAWLALAIATICWGAVHAEGGTNKSAVDCAEVVANLRAMRKAQAALMNTLVKKNDSMAETLDLYAQRMSRNQGRAGKTEITSLKKSAQSFRKHGARERGVVQRFETISEQVMARLEACLAKPAPARPAPAKAPTFAQRR